MVYKHKPRSDAKSQTCKRRSQEGLGRKIYPVDVARGEGLGIATTLLMAGRPKESVFSTLRKLDNGEIFPVAETISDAKKEMGRKNGL